MTSERVDREAVIARPSCGITKAIRDTAASGRPFGAKDVPFDGDRAAVAQTICNLVRDGHLCRISRGLYQSAGRHLTRSAPTGYKVLLLGNEEAQFSCDRCPSRECECASKASDKAKRLAERHPGKLVEVATLAGVVLQQTRGTGSGTFSMNTTKGRQKRAPRSWKVVGDE